MKMKVNGTHNSIVSLCFYVYVNQVLRRGLQRKQASDARSMTMTVSACSKPSTTIQQALPTQTKQWDMKESPTKWRHLKEYYKIKRETGRHRKPKVYIYKHMILTLHFTFNNVHAMKWLCRSIYASLIRGTN